MKKFYKLVSHRAENGGYHILLDGKPVKRPSKANLLVPSQHLADEIVKEWAAQKEAIIPDTMPVTQLLITCQDRVAQERDVMQAAALKYLDTDLVCYPAENPAALVALQEERWGVWRTWFENRFGAKLEITTGLAAIAQDENLRKSVAAYIMSLSDDHFTVLQLVTSLSGSLVLALAFTEGEAAPEDVIKAAFAEEDYQGTIYGADRYGEDPMLAKQRKAMTRDLNAARVYLECLS